MSTKLLESLAGTVVDAPFTVGNLQVFGCVGPSMTVCDT